MLKPPFYVISDTHWFHNNIMKYCNRDMNHNEIMIKRWNATVSEHDVVLHLGDVAFTKRNADQFFHQVAPALNGKKFLILGNHDDARLASRYEAAGFKVIQPFTMRYKGFEISFDHYPTKRGVIKPGDNCIRVHGHVHNHGYQSIHEKRKETKRYGNINVSVEEIDYTPQVIETLLDKAVAEMKHRQKYVNVNSKCNGTKQSDRHAA